MRGDGTLDSAGFGGQTGGAAPPGGTTFPGATFPGVPRP